ncbi:MAG: hypothetical protein LBT89_00675 [Planctomycetaceae bacterium]|jgi:hypothetical protein|nr:hypothetical protein [Planctomycetaceae bacterium]
MTNFPLGKIRWSEALAYLVMLVIGSVVFALQLAAWAIPQLTLYQTFVPSRGTVLEVRISEKKVSRPQTGIATLYRPEVLLEHETDDRTYRIWTFDYPTLTGGGYTADRNEAENALKPFVPSRRVPCWYRAERPDLAIIVWNISVWGWCLLVLSFALIVIGVIGFFQSFRYLAVSRERQSVLVEPPGTQSGLWKTVPDIRTVNESPGIRLAYRLPLGSSPVIPIAGMAVFAAAWNIVAVGILIHLFVVPAETQIDQILGIVLRALFCTFGILLLWRVLGQLWTILRVAPTLLELSDHPVYPGRKYRVLLFQNGIFHFRLLQVDLVCEEIARFHQGTDTATSRKEVYRQMLFSQSDFSTSPEMPLDKEFSLQLPHGAMHSFRQENNEIIWQLTLRIQLADRQEIHRGCTIVVRPANEFDSAG